MHKWRPEADGGIALRGARRGGHIVAAGGLAVVVVSIAAAVGVAPLSHGPVAVVLGVGAVAVVVALGVLGPRSTACAVRRGVLAALLQITLLAAAWLALTQ
ncbi:MAG: hypothetical protein M3387_11845 [Actinomycetota bacterium]|nr:hypothetical protein [Actinomycetota bacterium]